MSNGDAPEFSEVENAIVEFGIRNPQRLASLNDVAQERANLASQARIGSDYARQLLGVFASFGRRTEFQEGDLVAWKADLRNKRRPEYGEPVVVVEVLSDPIFDVTEPSGSTYFREPLDMVIGLLDEDNEFITFYVDSRRFQKFPAPSA